MESDKKMAKEILPKGGEGPVAAWGTSFAYCAVSAVVDWWPYFAKDTPVSEIDQNLFVAALGIVIAGVIRQVFKIKEPTTQTEEPKP